ncbi:MAG: hypothetical protein ACJ72N_04605 [Labedaea sp.]
MRPAHIVGQARGVRRPPAHHWNAVDRILLAILLLAVLGKLADAAIGFLERRPLASWT